MAQPDDGPTVPLLIAVDDPGRDDVRALLERHLAFAHEHTPPEDVHALDLAGLLDARVTFCTSRVAGELLGMGALKELDARHGELKSMHTTAEARGRGIGRAMVEHLLGLARARGYERVSLETAGLDGFVPALTLYASIGFVPCGPFADYRPSPNSTFLTLVLDA